MFFLGHGSYRRFLRFGNKVFPFLGRDKDGNLDSASGNNLRTLLASGAQKLLKPLRCITIPPNHKQSLFLYSYYWQTGEVHHLRVPVVWQCLPVRF
jgi:phosphatidylserine decarboxylase